MHVKRLELLAERLKTIPKHKFNLSAWMSEGCSEYGNAKTKKTWDGGGGFTTAQQAKRPYSEYNPTHDIVDVRECQTVGCAMGWAATMPEFKKLGLRLMGERNNTQAVICIVKKDVIVASHFEAASKIFKIPPRVAEVLFDPSEYSCNEPKPGPKDVIKRIKDLIKGKVVVGIYYTVQYQDGSPMVLDRNSNEWVDAVSLFVT